MREPTEPGEGNGTVPSRAPYERGWLRVDFDAYEVRVEGRRTTVHLREFEILRTLLGAPNRVFTREELIAAVWQGHRGVKRRTIDVHLRRLRFHLGDGIGRPPVLCTVRGVGYKFDEHALGPVTDSVTKL